MPTPSVREDPSPLASAGSDVSTPLLRSKLRPPSAPDHLVDRPRLGARLDAVLHKPLAVVVAPAGSGKTQLVANWLISCAVESCWLSLDEGDDDVAALWTGVTSALEPLAPGCGRAIRSLLSLGTSVDNVVRTVLDDLDSRPVERAVFVVDDVHHLVRDEARRSLSTFVEHLPAWLHVVLLSRSTPQLPLDRLRGRGQLVDLGYDDLRFTAHETSQVLSQLTPALSADEVDVVAERTDGWIVGIQLAALATRAGANAEGVAMWRSSANTESYVVGEVLSMGDPTIVDLLEDLAVVDRFNPSLAAAITGHDDIRDDLCKAESTGLFVRRIDGEDWFRIHPLVREVLLERLVRTGRHVEMHTRAAQWFEAADEAAEAIDQWLRAGRQRDALRVVAANSTQLYDAGRASVITRTVEAIDPAVAMGDMSAAIDAAVSQILISPPALVAALQRAIWLAERTEGSSSAQLAALHSLAHLVGGDWARAQEAAQSALDGFGDDWWEDPVGRYMWTALARCATFAERWDDDDPAIRDASYAMSRQPGRARSFAGIRAMGLAMSGRPIAALRVTDELGDVATPMALLRSEAGIARAIARRELGDHDSVLDDLTRVAESPSTVPAFRLVALHVLLADARERGEFDEAAALLDRADSLVVEFGCRADVMDWSRRSKVELELASGRLEQALHESKSIDDPFWGPVCAARVDLAFGDAQRAIISLDRAVVRCPRHEVVQLLLRARASGSKQDAQGYVIEAVDIASLNGMIRTVAVDGGYLMDMIERAACRVSAEWLDRVRLEALDTHRPNPKRVPQPTDRLTEREREVLRLLPSRLTLTEIARELYISPNTLKFHLRTIYRKLGVSGRAEAAAVGRALNQHSVRSTRSA